MASYQHKQHVNPFDYGMLVVPDYVQKMNAQEVEKELEYIDKELHVARHGDKKKKKKPDMMYARDLVERREILWHHKYNELKEPTPEQEAALWLE